MPTIILRKPLVSVGIPTYNRPLGLQRTLQYITKQTYTNLEIIVSDNHSPGNETHDVVHEFMNSDKRIKYYRQPVNIGLALNFQFVFDKAEGEYFMWAADDDEWDHTYIASLLERFDNNTTLVCSTMEVHKRAIGSREPIGMPVFTDNMTVYQRIKAFFACMNPCMIYGIFDRNKLIDIFDARASFEWYDCALLIRILSISNIKIVNKVLFSAGIDDAEYVYKSAKVIKSRRFVYWPVFKYVYSIIFSSNMRITEKTVLILKLCEFVFGNYIIHEKGYSKDTALNWLKYNAIRALMEFRSFVVKYLGAAISYSSKIRAKLKRFSPRLKQISYSQCGEDRIIKFIFNTLRISKVTYLDIGAHHPTYLSNTFLFYQEGGHGVCVEPDPLLFEAIKKKRKRDRCLNVGIGSDKLDAADFYVMTEKTLNTFSREEAERYTSYGRQKIEKIVTIPMMPVSLLITEYFHACPNLISLDVEGLDLQILEQFDFVSFRPEVLCVETITYTEDGTETKVREIIDFMTSKGYMVYADTYINTIFVDKGRWTNRSI